MVPVKITTQYKISASKKRGECYCVVNIITSTFLLAWAKGIPIFSFMTIFCSAYHEPLNIAWSLKYLHNEPLRKGTNPLKNNLSFIIGIQSLSVLTEK